MVVPGLTPRVEQWNHLASVAVNARDIRALAQVTSITSKGAVVGIIAATMLSRYDVFKVECGGYELFG